MKISLIQPVHSDFVVMKTGSRQKIFKPAQLTMPYIAACTPDKYDIEIHDEIVKPLDVSKINGEVVGITAVTPFVHRAYSLAKELRKKGQTVVLGGPHASSVPEEAAQHVDVVVVGEGDFLWKDVLNDFEKGKLKKIYRNSKEIPLENLPIPRWDLMDEKRYYIPQVVQASRGCPHRCDFCALNLVYPGYRCRPVDDVVREVSMIPHKKFVFWDDNICGNRAWAKELFLKLKPLKKRWFGQSTINMAKDLDLVKLASESGCKGLFVGLESFNANSLKGANKGFNKTVEYKNLVSRLNRHGIGVMAGLMFGFDTDDSGTFDNTLRQCIDIGLTAVSCSIVVPYPGTELFQRLSDEKRLYTTDWSKYTSDDVVFRHENLSDMDIKNGYQYVGANFFKFGSIFKRWVKTGFLSPKAYWGLNYANNIYFRKLEEGLSGKSQE